MCSLQPFKVIVVSDRSLFVFSFPQIFVGWYTTLIERSISVEHMAHGNNGCRDRIYYEITRITLTIGNEHVSPEKVLECFNMKKCLDATVQLPQN